MVQDSSDSRKNIPLLRFPEFRNKKAWQVKRLSQIANIIKGEQLSIHDITEGPYPVWNGGIKPVGFHHEYNCGKHTITINKSGANSGSVGRPDCDFWLGSHCYAIGELAKQIDADFLFQILKYNEKKIMGFRDESFLKTIPIKDLENFSIPVPSLPEQRKIAEFLILSDKMIDIEESRLELLKTHKLGLMQNLFPCDIDDEISYKKKKSLEIKDVSLSLNI